MKADDAAIEDFCLVLRDVTMLDGHDASSEAKGPWDSVRCVRRRWLAGDGMRLSRVLVFLKYLAIAVILVAGILALRTCAGGYPKPWPQRAFDSETWKRAQTSHDDRGRMIDALLQDHGLLGKTRGEVGQVEQGKDLRLFQRRRLVASPISLRSTRKGFALLRRLPLAFRVGQRASMICGNVDFDGDGALDVLIGTAGPPGFARLSLGLDSR